MSELTWKERGLIDYCLISRRVDLQRLVESKTLTEEVKESYRKKLYEVNALYSKLQDMKKA
jgi:hypothetical protein